MMRDTSPTERRVRRRDGPRAVLGQVYIGHEQAQGRLYVVQAFHCDLEAAL